MANATLSPINGGNFIHNTKRNVDGGSIMKRFSLAGKTAIITGAGAGIGYSVATAYAEMGANIAIWYHTNTKAVPRAEELAKQYNIKCR
jgi:sorbose reductase